MLECWSSQQGLPSSSVWAKVWQPEHEIASRRLTQLPSAMLVVNNEQLRQYRINFLWCRPDVIPSRMRLLYEMSWGMLLELTFPRIQVITFMGRVVFGLGENVFAFPWPDFTNRRVWTGHKIRSTGLITIGILYSSPVSNVTVLTLQIDVLECGEDVEADFKMPICLHMAARLHHGLGGYQQRWKNIPTHRDKGHDDRFMPQGWYPGRLRQTEHWCNQNQFILMDDNARLHRARVVEEYLQQETIVRMDWPACSPDLNPIEHVCNMLQVEIVRRQVQATTLVELENVLIEEWNNIKMAAIQRLIGSMRRRCETVIASRGSHTSYWQLLFLVFEVFWTFSWPGVTLRNFNLLGYNSLTTERLLHIVQIWYTTMRFRK